MFDALSNYINEVIRDKKIRVGGKDAQWRKVANIKVGDSIAVAGDMRSEDLTNFGSGKSDVFFDEIVSIKRLSPERVYDIEVEGTHNFVAGHFIDRPSAEFDRRYKHVPTDVLKWDKLSKNKNKIGSGTFGGIIAHNTYISGNVGIGTTSPTGRLDIVGSQNFSAFSTPGALTAGTPTTGGSCTAGTHSYKVTFVSVGNGETTGGTTSNQITCVLTTGQTVALSAIPTGPAGTTARKIYRTVAGDTGSYLLLTTISDNTTTIYSDTTADASLGAAAPVSNTTAVANLQTGGTTRMVIDNSGNVGIGTTAPQALLSLYQTSSATTDLLELLTSGATGNYSADLLQLTIDSANTGGAASGFYGNGVKIVVDTSQTISTASALLIEDDAGTDLFNLIANTGNIGIGDSSPDGLIDLSSGSSSATDFVIDNSSTGDPRILFQLSGTSNFALGIDNSDSDKFKIGTTALETNTLLALDPRSTTTGVSAITLAGIAPTLASGAGIEYTTLTVTPPTITLTGGTTVNLQMDSILINAPTITDSTTIAVDDAATFTLAGPPTGTGSVTIGESYGLKINTAAITNTTIGYGLYVEAPSGATNNYGGVFRRDVDGDAVPLILVNTTQADTSTNETTSLAFNFARSTGAFMSAGKILAGKEDDYAVSPDDGRDSFLAFYTSANNTDTEYMRIKSNGNIGIRSTSPLTSLDITGNLRTTGKATAVLTGSIDPIASSTVTGVSTLFSTELVVGDRITVTGETRTVTAIASNTSLTIDSAFSDNANDASPDVLYALATYRTSAGSTIGVINDLGNVGVGNAAPSTTLHVTGGARITGLVSCDTIDTDANGVLSCGTDTGGGSSPFTSSGGVITKGTIADRLSLLYGDAGDVQLEIENTTNSTIPTADVMQLNLTGGTGITTNGVDGLYINIEGANGTANSVSALHLDFDPIGGSGDEFFTALDIDGITGTSAAEQAIRIGSGWDAAIKFSGASDLDIADNTASAFTISEGTNNFFLITTTNNTEVVTLDLPTGGATSNTLNLATSNSDKTINIGTGTGTDTINIGTGTTTGDIINIGNSAATHTISIGSTSATTVSITDNHWSISDTGAANFATLQGAGLTDCDGADDMLLWDATNKTFSCGTDNNAIAIGPWNLNDYATTQTSTQMDRQRGTLSSTASELKMPYAGSIVAIDVGTSGAFTAGTLTLEVWKNNTGGAQFTCTVTTTATVYCSQADGTDTFAVGDELDIRYSSTSDLAPTTRDGTVNLWVQISGGADLAELYNVKDPTIEPGDVLVLDPSIPDGVKKSSVPYESTLMGAVSTQPGQILGQTEIPDLGSSTALALTGRIPVKISHTSLPIKAGDPLTSSSEPGRAMKSLQAGQIIGKALEDWDPESGKDKIMVFVNLTHHDPHLVLNDAGNLNIEVPQEENGKYSLKDQAGNIITRIGAFSDIISGNIKSGAVTAREVATDNLTIAGQSLRDYIIEVVKEARLVITPDSTLISPKVETASLQTDFISPLSTASSGLIINLDQNQTLDITSNQGSSSGSPVVSIDSQGNATFSGTLSADRLEGDISSGQITDLSQLLASNSSSLREQILSDIAALTNTPTPIPVTTPSPTPTPESPLSPVPSPDPTIIDNLITNIPTPTDLDLYSFDATTSGILDTKFDNSQFDTITITDSLTVLGPASLSDTTFAGSILIDGEISINHSGINSLSGPLRLNPLGTSGIEFLSGRVAIDPQGNMLIAGNLTVEGDAFIKGSLTTEKLNISTPEATSSSDLSGNSAGSATLARNRTEIIIETSSITESSLIYITPITSTGNQVLFVKSQQTCAPNSFDCTPSFKVGIDSPLTTDIKFNWWIVN